MSVEPGYHLKQTNVSQPQLSHSSSQRSIAASQAASEGYYSASEHNSSDSDERRRIYQTPTTRSHEQLHTQQAPVTSLRGVGIPRGQLQQPHAAHLQGRPISTITEERRSMDTRRRSNLDPDSQATTPGQDTTPYIRFAIDQLTRDEEVRGSRVYPDVRYEEDYPVERIVPDDGLGYMAQEQQTQKRMSEHMAPDRHSRRHSIPRKPVATPNVQFSSPAPAYESPARTRQPPYYQQQTEPLLREDPRMQYPQASAFSVDKDVFVAQDPDHLPLHFVPVILRPVWLGLFIALCLLMLAGLIASAVLSLQNNGAGLWDYASFGDVRYFVFQYLPTMLGMFLFLWLIQIQTALQRTMPFLSMASDSFHRRSEAPFLDLYPMQFLLPRTEYFRAGHPAIGACYVVFWLFAWSIPLLASSFNVRYDTTTSAWRWVAVQGVLWTVVALYILLIAALITVMITLRQPTGLRWDPRSLADIIALFSHSNVTAAYEGSETFTSADWDRLRNRADRIGYWTTSNRGTDMFYSIGEENGETRRFSLEEGRMREKPRAAFTHSDPQPQQGDFHIRADLRSAAVRLRYLPWFFKDGAVIAFLVAAVLLLIAFYAVSFTNSTIRLGFPPSVPAQTNSGGFSAANFLFSFIPALLGTILFLAMLGLDYARRALQPYMSLSTPGGNTASATLLLDLPAQSSLSAPLAALKEKHYATCLLSLSSLLSTALPILAGGLFWTQFYASSSSVRVSAHVPAFYALCLFLALYVLGLFAVLPGRSSARTPHAGLSVAGVGSWVYASRILAEAGFRHQGRRREMVDRLLGERYGFGVFVGRDGRESLGIERLLRPGGEGLVFWEEEVRGKRRSRKGGRRRHRKEEKREGSETENMV